MRVPGMPPAMKPKELCRRLTHIIRTAPSPLEDGPLPSEVMKWVGDASALIQVTGDLTFSAETQIAINGLHHDNRIVSFQKLLLILHKALALTQLDLPPGGLILSDGNKPAGPTGPSGKPNPDLMGLNGPTGPTPRQVVPLQGVAALGQADEIRPRIENDFPFGASTDSNPPFYYRPPPQTVHPSNADLPQRSSSLTRDELASTRVAKTQADYETLMARVALLEAALLPLLPTSTSRDELAIGIGHNRAPIEFGAASVDDLMEINQLIGLLKDQGPTPPTNPAPILELETKTGNTATKIKEYIDDCGKAATKGFGEETGKRLAQSPFWIALFYQMGQVSEALIRWLSNIPH